MWLWLESAGDIATEVASNQILGGVGAKIGKKSLSCLQGKATGNDPSAGSLTFVLVSDL